MTQRLALRAPRQEDAPAMLALRNSAFVRRYNPMKVWDLPRMEREIEEERARPGRVFYLFERESGVLLGGVWLADDDLRYGPVSFCLSYYLGEQAAGQGYMTEALSAVIAFAFKDLQAQVLCARVFKGNEASLRLLKRLGFTHEGTLRKAVLTPEGQVFDDMLFSLLREEASGL